MPNETETSPLRFGAEVDPRNVGMTQAGVLRMIQVFEDQIEADLHPGAQWVVLSQGQVVLDRATGIAHLKRRMPVRHDTPFLVFSTTKPLTAACILQLVEQGKIELDAPVADYWPEFGCKGKQSATIRHVLLHQAGVPGALAQLQFFHWPDWERATRDVARARAEYPPGTKTAYHAVNFGFILGEVLRRVSGMPIQDYMKQHFLEPLGMQNSALGLSDDWRGRAAGIYSGHWTQDGAVFAFNRPAIRRAVLPAASLHSTARDLAIFFQMLVNGGVYAGRRYLQAETIRQATQLGFEGRDALLLRDMRYGMGFILGGLSPLGEGGPIGMGRASSARTFGHHGQVSCTAWGDADAGLVMAFTCNRLLASRKAHERWQALSDAVWGARASNP